MQNTERYQTRLEQREDGLVAWELLLDPEDVELNLLSSNSTKSNNNWKTNSHYTWHWQTLGILY